MSPNNKRKLNRQILVNTWGNGKGCQLCGYNKCIGALDFHHIDPTKKELDISKFAGKNKLSYAMLNELTKCCLLCKNCHAEVHAGMHAEEIKELLIPDIKEFLEW